MSEAAPSSAARRRGRSLRIARAAAGGLLAGLAFPTPGWGPLLVPGVAIAVGLAASPRGPREGRAAWEGAAFGFVQTVLMLRWFATPILLFSELGAFLAWLAVFLSGAILAALWAGLFELLSRWSRRLGTGIALLLAPSLLTAYDLLREWFPFPFPWGSAAAALARYEGIPLLASGVGTAGVSFLLYALAALLAAAFLLPRRRVIAAGISWTLLAIGALGLGDLPSDERGDRVRVAVLQASLPRHATATEEWVAYRDLTAQAARAGARIVVWPESAVSYSFDPDGGWAARLAELAAREGADLVVGGLTRATSGRYQNSSVLVRAEGGPPAVAPKRQLVPFGEYMPLRFLLGNVPALAAEVGDFEPGREAVVFEAREARIGPLVCFEAVFPGLSRDLVERGADLLVNQTNDSWFGRTGGPRQHLDHAILRSAETGRPLARAANSGISAIVVAGEVRDSLPTGVRGLLVADLDLPRRGDVPPGMTAGRVIAWGSLALTLLAVAGIVPRRRGARPATMKGDELHDA